MTRAIDRRKNAGFTLVEVVVALGILALLMSIAIPSFNGMTRARKLNGALRKAKANVVAARFHAAKGEMIGAAPARFGGIQYVNPTQYNIVISTAAGGPWTAVKAVDLTNDGVTVGDPGAPIVFRGNGTLATGSPTTLTFTDSHVSPPKQRSLQVNLGGGVTIAP